MDISTRIRTTRKKMHLTQKQLASKVNVSAQVISNWERGYTNPDYDDVLRLAQALDTSADYLMGLTDNPSRDEGKASKNARELLKGDLHWDGVPLAEGELKLIRELFEVVVRERIPRYLEEQKKKKGDDD